MPLALHSSIAKIASVSILIWKPAKGVGFVLALKCEGRQNTDMLITHISLIALNRLGLFFFFPELQSDLERKKKKEKSSFITLQFYKANFSCFIMIFKIIFFSV